MAVHVWSLWGLGGIVGPPVLKAAVAPQDARWELAFAKGSAASRYALNRMSDAESAIASVSGGAPLEWTEAAMPWKEFANWPDDVHYAVFRLKFDFLQADGTPRSLNAPVVMDIGAVFDVAAFYLNGRRVGLTGRFPENGEPAFTEAAQRGQFIVFPEDWSEDGHNELVAVVYRERGVGGLPGVPGILLANPMEKGADQSFSEKSSLFNIFLQSERFFDAERVLDTTGAESDADRAWLLSLRAHLAFLKWLDGGRKDDALLDAVLAPIEPGHGDDVLLSHTSGWAKDWPLFYNLPTNPQTDFAIEDDAIMHSEAEFENNRYSSLDWGCPGKNHRHSTDWND